MGPQYSIRERPDPRDGIPIDMCRRCGLRGNHPDAGACIDALRSEIADLQFRKSANHSFETKRRMAAAKVARKVGSTWMRS